MTRSVVAWSGVAVLAVAFVVGGGALGGSALGGSALGANGTTRASGSQTFRVDVDGSNRKTNESFDAYFPGNSTVHAGDTVVFHYAGVGEPHTVTLGALANTADTAFDKLSPAQQNNPPKSALAADAKLPQLTEGAALSVTPSAADPCFLASGVPSAKQACPVVAKPAFDGSQSYYNSGWLASKENFTVHLSSSTPTGTYRFLCLIHREGMQGKITVVPSGKPVPSPAAQYAAGQKQLVADEAGLAAPAKLLTQGKPPIPGLTLPGSDPVLAGSGAPESPDPGRSTSSGPGSSAYRWVAR